jgi:uncharacterized protein with HEPN domain
MSRNYLIRLRDMLAAAERASAYGSSAASASSLGANRQVLDAILFNLFVLGEAAKGVPTEVRSRYPGVQWKAMAGLRDVLVHEYFGVDTDIVWDVVRAELPRLIEQLPKIIATEEKEQGSAR